MRAVHARIFGHVLGRCVADDRYDDAEAERLAVVTRCLSRLGWAPGEGARTR
jgi:hypothetical protein